MMQLRLADGPGAMRFVRCAGDGELRRVTALRIDSHDMESSMSP